MIESDYIALKDFCKQTGIKIWPLRNLHYSGKLDFHKLAGQRLAYLTKADANKILGKMKKVEVTNLEDIRI